MFHVEQFTDSFVPDIPVEGYKEGPKCRHRRTKGIPPVHPSKHGAIASPPPHLPLPIATQKRSRIVQDIARQFIHMRVTNIHYLSAMYGQTREYIQRVCDSDKWNDFAVELMAKQMEQNSSQVAEKKDFFEEADIKQEYQDQRSNLPQLKAERTTILDQMAACESKKSTAYRSLLASYRDITKLIESHSGKDFFQDQQVKKRDIILKLRAQAAQRNLTGKKEPGQDIEDDKIIEMVSDEEEMPVFRPSLLKSFDTGPVLELSGPD